MTRATTEAGYHDLLADRLDALSGLGGLGLLGGVAIKEAASIIRSISTPPMGPNELSGSPGELKAAVELSKNLGELKARPVGVAETTAQACLRMADDRAVSIPPAVRCVLRLAHDELEALAQPGSDGSIHVASPLERERFLSIVGRALNAAYDAGQDYSQGFDPMAVAGVVMQALASTPAIREGGGT